MRERVIRRAWEGELAITLSLRAKARRQVIPIDIRYEHSLCSYRHAIGEQYWSEISQIFCRERWTS